MFHLTIGDLKPTVTEKDAREVLAPYNRRAKPVPLREIERLFKRKPVNLERMDRILCGLDPETGKLKGLRLRNLFSLFKK